MCASAWAVASTLPALTVAAGPCGDLLEHLALVGGIALHRLDQIGDEVGAAAQLDGDSAEAFLDQRAQAHQPIVDRDCVEQQQRRRLPTMTQPKMPM